MAEHEHVVNITSLSELQQAANSKGSARRRRVQLTDVSQADLDEMATYYGEAPGRSVAGGSEAAETAAANKRPSSNTDGSQAASGADAVAGEAVHKSKLAIVSTIRPKGR